MERLPKNKLFGNDYTCLFLKFDNQAFPSNGSRESLTPENRNLTACSQSQK